MLISSRAACLFLQMVQIIRGGIMVRKSIQDYFVDKQFTPDQLVLAHLCLQLAASFDDTGNTSTAAELRKTFTELRNQLEAAVVEVDPIEELLKRDA